MANDELIAGRELHVSNRGKVMYPATGTTKGTVIDYYLQVAPYLIPLAADRPVTRKRWVHGVGTDDKPGAVFFRKDLEDGAPDWVPRVTFRHKNSTNTYPLASEPAVLAWFGQLAALELHVPQWQFTEDGAPRNPDRFVLDLDPGPGAELAQCVEVAFLCREILSDMGLETIPVTSGSKGIHLYAKLDGTVSSDDASAVAKELARAVEGKHPTWRFPICARSYAKARSSSTGAKTAPPKPRSAPTPCASVPAPQLPPRAPGRNWEKKGRRTKVYGRSSTASRTALTQWRDSGNRPRLCPRTQPRRVTNSKFIAQNEIPTARQNQYRHRPQMSRPALSSSNQYS